MSRWPTSKYAIAHPAIVQKMRSHAIMGSINEVAIQAAIAALEDIEGMQNSVKRSEDDRQEFFNSAMARRLMPIDSYANFMMMNVHHPAKEVIQHFEKNNILVGRRVPQWENYIRVSLGLPEEMRVGHATDAMKPSLRNPVLGHFEAEHNSCWCTAADLALNNGRCPLTALAARFTNERADNFDRLHSQRGQAESQVFPPCVPAFPIPPAPFVF